MARHCYAAMVEIDRFTEELRRQEKAPNTIQSYRYDLVLFSRWLEATYGEPFQADRVTPTDLREYRT
jgi:site-specific recombinase XerD